jgi:hypothetical protein
MPVLTCAACFVTAHPYPQANCAADEMREMCQRDGVRGLPYFRFHASGRVLGEFPANLHKVGRLREEIANMKMRVAGS